MSELKGTLLTMILALAVFGIVYGIVSTTIKNKATDISNTIADAGTSDLKTSVSYIL